MRLPPALLPLVLLACAGPRTGLARLTPHLDRPLSAAQREEVQAAQAQGTPTERALAAALLFRDDPAHPLALLAPWFRVHEAAGTPARDISQAELVQRVDAAAAEHPEVRDQRVQMLRAYLSVREQNLWFTAGGQRLSAARFLRSAFLAVVFKGTALDAVEVAQRLDVQGREPG